MELDEEAKLVIDHALELAEQQDGRVESLYAFCEKKMEEAEEALLKIAAHRLSVAERN